MKNYILGVGLITLSLSVFAMDDYPAKCSVYNNQGSVVKTVEGTIEVGSKTVVVEVDKIFFSMPLTHSQKGAQLYANDNSRTLVTMNTNHVGRITTSGNMDFNNSYECTVMVRKI